MKALQIVTIAKKSLIIALPAFVVGLFLVIPVFIAGWYTGYSYVASAVDDTVKEHLEAVKEHLEARDKLRDALIDVLKYKVELQEKEGCK